MDECTIAINQEDAELWPRSCVRVRHLWLSERNGKVHRFTDIEHWNAYRLTELPSVEDESLEYKSSLAWGDDLRKKISVAASAFWNSGGGALIVGVNDNGEVNGGIPSLVGRTKLEDWVDTAIARTEPIGPYKIKLIKSDDPTLGIEKGKVVLIIRFDESGYIPHMAWDKKHYIRVGAHSTPAGYYIVEALRARRVMRAPVLRGIIREDFQRSGAIELVVVALNDAPALDVELSFDPLPILFADHANSFPLVIPVIDKNTPFSMDISILTLGGSVLGNRPVSLRLAYEDLLGRELGHTQLLRIDNSVGPLRFGRDALVNISKAIESLTKEVNTLNRRIKK